MEGVTTNVTTLYDVTTPPEYDVTTFDGNLWNTTAYRQPPMLFRIEPINKQVVRQVVLSSYLVTFLFGLVGNTLVMFVIFRYPKIRSRSVTNYYIWNLCLADELFVLTLPFFCYTTYKTDWIFGEVSCRFAFLFRECNKFASVFTLTAISVDRYLATYHNMGKFRQIRVGVGVCVVIWALSLAGCTPYLIYGRTMRNPNNNTTSCRFHWPRLHDQEVWTYVQLVLGLLVPLLIIFLFNVLLVRRLNELARVKRRTSCTSTAENRGRSSVTRMLTAVVVIFFVCQLPYHIVEIISLEVKKTGRQPNPHVFVYCNVVAQILVFVSSSCNPILYGIFNKNYRKLYRHAIVCGKFQRRSSSSTGVAAVAVAAAAHAAVIAAATGTGSSERRLIKPAARSSQTFTSADFKRSFAEKPNRKRRQKSTVRTGNGTEMVDEKQEMMILDRIR